MSVLITEAVSEGPGAPTWLTPIEGDRTITLKWTHPSDISIADINRYRFYTSSPGNATTQSLLWPGTSANDNPEAFTENPSYLVYGLDNGKEYTFTLEAVNNDDEVGTMSTSLKATPKMPAPTGFTATLDDPTTEERTVTLTWTAIPRLNFGTATPNVTDYEYSQNGGAWTSIGSTNTTYTVPGLENGISYTFGVRGVRGSEPKGLPSRVTLTPLINAPGTPGTLNVQRVDDTATLTWTPPGNPETIIRYEYSDDGGATWQSTGSTDTTYTVTGLEAGQTYTFLIRVVYVDGGNSRIISPRSRSSNAAVLSLPKRRIIQECPVGWVRSDGFAGRNRRVLIYEVKLQMDMQDRVSIYKPVWVAIYVHPDEGLENLDGWKLQVALPYNHHRDYLLTAENSVVVDAGFVEGGFAFIENPKKASFPMTGMGFPGSPAPGFDYRLYDETGRKVDFGISCYKRFDVFQVLKEMEDPRVLRKVLLESLDWDASTYIRSEWTVPIPVPAAPSLLKKTVVGTWADLKK